MVPRCRATSDELVAGFQVSTDRRRDTRIASHRHARNHLAKVRTPQSHAGTRGAGRYPRWVQTILRDGSPDPRRTCWSAADRAGDHGAVVLAEQPACGTVGLLAGRIADRN